MLFSDLVATSRRVAATTARLEKVDLLASFLRKLEPQEIEAGVVFLTGHLRQGRIGLGWAALQTAAGAGLGALPATAGTGVPSAPPSQLAFEDPSFRAASADVPAARVPTLTLSDVDAHFDRIGRLTGRGSAAARNRRLAQLLRRATPDERDFLVRLIMGELRQGALAGVMEDAIAAAAEIPVAEIRRAAMLTGDLESVARAALTEGRAGLGRFRLVLFRPIKPMLAQPAESLSEGLERLGEAALEYKLDGARVQAHRSGSEIRIFSRRMNEVTEAVPELVEAVRALPVRDVILDGEVVAMRPDGAPQPFQVTMRRFGRKLDVERLRAELPLTPFFFDILHRDGQDLFDAPARDRFAALLGAAPGLVIPRTVTADLATAEKFFDESLERGHEGVMAKATAAPYEAGSRGFAWLKVKPAHTLDLVVLAAEWGHGRRTGWLSNLHLGALDPATGGFVMLGKTFKGMTDEMLEWQTTKFRELEVASDGHTVQLRPKLVVEVAFSDVQESPQYPAGMALRFARVKRYREDKPASEADTVETVRAILRGQTRKGRSGGA